MRTAVLVGILALTLGALTGCKDSPSTGGQGAAVMPPDAKGTGTGAGGVPPARAGGRMPKAPQ